MEPGTLELQIFVSLIVVLGAAFVALVCDYLKGNNETLREHNIELRVRKEEQEKHKPAEAVEWLQSLLGAKQRNPIRFGKMRPVRAGAEAKAEARPAEARGGERRPVDQPAGREAAAREMTGRGDGLVKADPVPIPSMRGPLRPHAHSPAVSSHPVGASAAHVAPVAAQNGHPSRAASQPEPVAPLPMRVPLVAQVVTQMADHGGGQAQVEHQVEEIAEVPAVPAAVATAGVDEPRKSRLAEARARRQDRPSSAPGLLESLPVPAWLKKEQEERAAARAMREHGKPAQDQAQEGEEAPEVQPAPLVSAAPERMEEPAMVPAQAAKTDNFWTYKGLLDRVVAATAHKPSPAVDEEPKPALGAASGRGSRKPAVQPSPMVEPALTEPSLQPVNANPEVSPAVEPAAAPEVVALAVVETSVVEALVESAVEPVAGVVESGSEPEATISTVAVDVPSGPMPESPAVVEESSQPVSVLKSADETASDESLTPLYETYEEWAAAQAKLVGMSFGQEPRSATEENGPVTVVSVQPASLNYDVEVETESLPVGSELVPIQTIPPAGFSEEEKSAPKLPAVPELGVPDGFHDKTVLQQLLQSPDVLTGVVVAIGINEHAHQLEKLGASHMADLMRSVEGMITGLLRPGMDFACRSSEDEFILIFPKETGAAAQRRLTAISERLWNFQLRSISNFSVLFSWGAVEVQAETLADAAAGASERMYQTKRSRKTVTLDTQRRKLAV